MLKIILYLFIFALCPMPYALCPSFAQDKVVAIVNQDVITQKDLNDFINFTRVQFSAEYKGRDLESKVQAMRLNLLNKLIEDRLILQEAKNNKIQLDENRVKARIAEIKEGFNSEAEFQKTIAQQGLAQADLETRIREQLLMQAVINIKIRSKIIVNPFEITDFYEKNKGEFKSAEQREFECMATEDENLAGQVYQGAKGGGTLEGLAKKYPIEVERVSFGRGGELKKDIEDTLFNLGLNEACRPIKIEGVFYIFRLCNIIPSQQQSLNEAQDTIYSYLFEKKMQEQLVKWLDEIKKKSYIKILAD